MEINAIARPFGLSPTMQFFIASVATMFGLALLDFIGAVFAKEWADTRNPLWFAAGLAAFVVLFVVYAGSLQTAELSIVTIGWVVFLQVGLVLYERVRYDAVLAPGKWVAVVAILVLQAYLVLTPNQQRGEAAADVVAVPAALEQPSFENGR